ncbi:PQQ-dependent sugar dehydrogenase [Mycolicibacterium sp. XJ870]
MTTAKARGKAVDAGLQKHQPAVATTYAKHVARVGALAVALGVGGALATTPGVAWAEDSASAESSESGPTESNAQTAETDTASTEPDTLPPSPSESGASEPTTGKSRQSADDNSTSRQKIVTLDGGVIVRSSGGAHTAGDEEDIVDEDVADDTAEEDAGDTAEDEVEDTAPADVDVTPILPAAAPVLESDPQDGSSHNDDAPWKRPFERIQHALTAAAVDPQPQADDTASLVKPTVSAAVTTAEEPRAITIPPLPIPGPDSPEPIRKAWDCFCKVFNEVAPVVQQIGSLVNRILGPLAAGPEPGETPESPGLWAVLAWVRRQTDQILSSPPVSDVVQAVTSWGVVSLQQVTQSCGGPVQGLPPDLERTVIVSGLSEPVDFRFLPDDPDNPDDGGILIAEKGGAIKLYKEGQGTTTLVTLPAQTDFESGIGGIEVDPNFAENHYVYVSYTRGDNVDVLSRLTLSGDSAAILASELELVASTEAAGPVHHGGEIYYQDNPDGTPDYIYWAKGDNSVSTNAQDLTNIHGKILRIHPDGSIPTDNPFYNTPGARQEIWAYGLRNPFRFDVAPNGQMLVGDVGDTAWEELNVLQKGANYGWPNAEGNCVGCGYVDPVYAYTHALSPSGSASIASVLVYTGDTLGEEYQGKVFIADYSLGWIKVLTFDEGYTSFVSEQTLDGQAGTPVRLIQGPDGNIYQLNIYPGELSVIAPSGGNRAPTAVVTATPSSGEAPLTVDFSSQGSSDPDPNTTLTYNWDFGDGTTSTQPNATKTYATDGTYHVTLTVSDGEKTGQATQTVTVGTTAPYDVTITTLEGEPLDNSKYNAGDTITFSATAKDDEPLPDDAYKWTVVFHHADHIHPVADNIVSQTGSIVVPRDPHNVANTWYEVRLTVTDSRGVSTTQTANVYPNTVTQTFTASDPDATFTIDGKPYTGSYTETSVVGVERVLGAPSPQFVDDGQLVFNNWSDGGAQTHTIVTPDTDTVYIVTYDRVPSVL